MMAEDLVENGWFIDSDGVVYAVVNGSAYEVDATGTPLTRLDPGSYTIEEAEDTLAQEQKSVSQLFAIERSRAQRLMREFDESKHPRDEAGKFTSGGGAGGSGASSSLGGKKIAYMDFALSGVSVEGTPQEKDALVEKWNEKIGMSPAEFRDQYLGNANSTMTVNYEAEHPLLGKTSRLLMSGELRDDTGKMIGEYASRIDFRENVVQAIGLNVQKGEQAKGHAKEVMAANVAMYEKMGIDKMVLNANISVGAYAWARYGMTPDDSSFGWKRLQGEMRKHLVLVDMPDTDRIAMTKLINNPDPKSVWAIADSKYGKDMLLNQSWNGELKLGDADSMKRFNAYVGRK